jgi:hypothetical protein
MLWDRADLQDLCRPRELDGYTAGEISPGEDPDVLAVHDRTYLEPAWRHDLNLHHGDRCLRLVPEERNHALSTMRKPRKAVPLAG